MKSFWLTAPLLYLIISVLEPQRACRVSKMLTPGSTKKRVWKSFTLFISRNHHQRDTNKLDTACSCLPNPASLWCFMLTEPHGGDGNKIWQSNWTEFFLVFCFGDSLYFTPGISLSSVRMLSDFCAGSFISTGTWVKRSSYFWEIEELCNDIKPCVKF